MQDAAAVKVLTLITLIYLPATVVLVSLTPQLIFMDMVAHEVSELLFHGVCSQGARVK